MVLSRHSIGLLLRATEPEWKLALKRPRYCVSLKTSVHSKCTLQVSDSTLQQVTFKHLGWYLRVTEGGTRKWHTDWLSKRSSAWALLLCIKRELSNTCQFLNRSLFRSSPVVMNLGSWLKEYYPKCKRKRWDFCKELMAWHLATMCTAVKFVKLWMSNHFSE